MNKTALEKNTPWIVPKKMIEGVGCLSAQIVNSHSYFNDMIWYDNLFGLFSYKNNFYNEMNNCNIYENKY